MLKGNTMAENEKVVDKSMKLKNEQIKNGKATGNNLNTSFYIVNYSPESP